MPLRVQLPDAAAAGDLLAFLRRMGADVERRGPSVYVTRRHPVVPGEPPDQDVTELTFVVRTWFATRAGQTPAFAVDEAPGYVERAA
jgi:hypothetical protein